MLIKTKSPSPRLFHCNNNNNWRWFCPMGVGLVLQLELVRADGGNTQGNKNIFGTADHFNL